MQVFRIGVGDVTEHSSCKLGNHGDCFQGRDHQASRFALAHFEINDL